MNTILIIRLFNNIFNAGVRLVTESFYSMVFALLLCKDLNTSSIPVSDEAGYTVTGQLSVGAVASIEAGVVSGVVAAHRNRQLRPSGRRQSHM